MVDHHNKLGAATSGAGGGEGLEPDVIVNLAGAISKGGIADSIWGLYRNKGKRGATLVVTGRDIEEQSIALQQDPVTHCLAAGNRSRRRQTATYPRAFGSLWRPFAAWVGKRPSLKSRKPCPCSAATFTTCCRTW